MKNDTYGNSKASQNLVEEIERIENKHLARKIGALLSDIGVDINSIKDIQNVKSKLRILAILKKDAIKRVVDLTSGHKAISTLTQNVVTAKFRDVFKKTTVIRKSQKLSQSKEDKKRNDNSRNN